MNKKMLFLLILFLPAIVAAVWFFSVSGNNVSLSNVSSVTLVFPDGSDKEFTTEEEKTFLVDFADNIVSIDNPSYDLDEFSLYTLCFHRVQGDNVYYLCLSADTRKCIAYDSKNNWYRIDKEYAKEFLALYGTDSIYKFSKIPTLIFTAHEISTELSATDGEWNYLLSDGSYSTTVIPEVQTVETNIFVVAGEGFDFDFTVSPDWCNVKIYDGDLMIYDGLLDSVTGFTHTVESKLRAVISAEWYEEDNDLYHGNAVYDFWFNFDLKTEYSVNADELLPGEILFVSLTNVNNEDLMVASTLSESGNASVYDYKENKVVAFPISSSAAAGEYWLNITSDKTAVSIPFTVKDKNFGSIGVGFVGSESFEEYENAVNAFTEEISSSLHYDYDSPSWMDGMITPVQKYVGSAEQYWISSPSYGVEQTLDGQTVSKRSFGIHYVKSVSFDSMPVRAVADGVVAFSDTTALYGNTLIIDHGLGVKSVYGHLDALNYSVGDKVEMSTVIANAKPSSFAVSSTELFFAVYSNGIFLNPYNFIVEPRSSTVSDISDKFEFLS